MKKTIMKVLLGAGLATAAVASANAAEPVNQDNRWGVGVFYNSTTPTDFLPMVTFDSASGTHFGLGATYTHNGADSSNNFYASGFIGQDIIKMGNLAISIGAAGGTTLNSPEFGTRLYNLGAYVGADFFITNNFKATAQLIALNYQQTEYGYKNWDAFGQGSIGLTYLF